jgi:V8-like Glu-specific endopeptidase
MARGRWEDDLLRIIGPGIGVRGLRDCAFEGAGREPVRVANPSYLRGAILAVAYVKDGLMSIEGTATMIAPGLAVTASHVLDPEFYGKRPHQQETEMRCLGLVEGPHGASFQEWNVDHTSRTLEERGEIGYISLSPSASVLQPTEVRTMPLSLDLPDEDEELTMVGYRFASDPKNLEGAMYVSKGPILRLLHTFTERQRIYPAYEVECETLPGMSGGPVLDRSGCLVGVISRGLDDVTYAAMIMHGMGSTVPIFWPPGEYPLPVRVHDIPQELLCVESRRKLSFSPDDSRIRWDIDWSRFDPESIRDLKPMDREEALAEIERRRRLRPEDRYR